MIVDGEFPFAQVVFASECLQRVDRAEAVLTAGFELQPWSLFGKHRAMHTQFPVTGITKQPHGAHQCLWLEIDVVVHEQHVGCPTLLAQHDESACETTGSPEVAVLDNLQRRARRSIEFDVASVVHHQDVQGVTKLVYSVDQLKDVAHCLLDVRLAVERGDRQRESNIMGRCIARHPLPASHTHLATFGSHTHVVHADCRRSE